MVSVLEMPFEELQLTLKLSGVSRHNLHGDDASLFSEQGEESAFNEPPEFQEENPPRPADCILRLSWLESCASGKGFLAFDSAAGPHWFLVQSLVLSKAYVCPGFWRRIETLRGDIDASDLT